ncbi:MAG: hypothetical protein GY917_08510, partial [Planctomycetaceae bacterium]|nr:hypothetical protein [Planctomycetaceae bacterium]
MFDASHYQLLDFGQGRKLERFGPLVLDRVCPVAEGEPISTPDAWKQSHFCYRRRQGGQGNWVANCPLPAKGIALGEDGLPSPWRIHHGPLQLEIRLTPSGQVGVFPEQAPNWDWLTRQLGRMKSPAKVLNLFAYTGGSTLAAAAAGA